MVDRDGAKVVLVDELGSDAGHRGAGGRDEVGVLAVVGAKGGGMG